MRRASGDLPQPMRDGGLQGRAIPLFRGLSPSYDAVLDCATLLQDRYWKSWLVQAAALKPRSMVLDLGCGTCVLGLYLSGKGHRVVGLDLTEEMVRRGQEKAIACIDSLMVGDAESLPYGDSTFDAVLSCYVAKYCDLGRLVDEVLRVLKPKGRLALYDFSAPRGWFGPFHAFYLYGAMRGMGRLLRRADAGVAFTFSYLPEVIRTRRWNEFIPRVMQERGFSAIAERSLSGGVVTAFLGTKSG